jgi:hypothetical protein
MRVPILTSMAFSSSLQSQAAQVFSFMVKSPESPPEFRAGVGDHLAAAAAVEIFSGF